MIMSEQDVVKSSFRIPKELKKNVKRFCVEADKTETEVISEALQEYLDRHKKDIKGK